MSNYEILIRSSDVNRLPKMISVISVWPAADHTSYVYINNVSDEDLLILKLSVPIIKIEYNI